MVKKLLKYEFGAMLKRLLPIYIVVLGTAVLNRIIQFFETDNTTYGIIFGSSAVLLAVSCIVLLVGTCWIVVSRYYRNLFTNEGYLTLSLPVTPDQHLGTKFLTAVVCMLISTAVCFLAGMIAMSNGVFTELMKAMNWLAREASRKIGAGHFAGITLEFLLAVLLSTGKSILVLYACVSIGQWGLKTKNRVAKAVGVFFIYYFALQVLATIFMIVIAILEMNGSLDALMKWIGLHAKATIHLSLWFGIIWSAGFGILYYLINRHVLAKKLNLE